VLAQKEPKNVKEKMGSCLVFRENLPSKDANMSKGLQCVPRAPHINIVKRITSYNLVPET